MSRGSAALLATAAALALGPVASAGQALSFERYRSDVEPVFIAPRGGHGPGASPCATCHVHNGTPMRLQPLQERPDGSVFWSEAQSRLNFEAVSRLVTPGDPQRSRLLRKALAEDAGGTNFHVGGKFFESQDDPEWRRMADWVRAAAPSTVRTAAPTLDFEFFRTCVQRIFLSKREGRAECKHCHGGPPRNFARTLPEGRDFWTDDESRENFAVLRRYIEPGEPLMSRFLTHPLAPDAGGDSMHSGGRRWMSQDDPEWRMLAAWVRGERPTCVVS